MQGWNPRLTDRAWEGILRLHSQRPDARSLRSSQEAQPVPTQELLQHPFAGATGPGSLAAGPGRRPRFPDVQVTAFPTTHHSNSSFVKNSKPHYLKKKTESNDDEGLNKMRSIHTAEYHSALRRKEILTCATAGADLKDAMLSETSQSQKDVRCTVPFMRGVQGCENHRGRT